MRKSILVLFALLLPFGALGPSLRAGDAADGPADPRMLAIDGEVSRGGEEAVTRIIPYLREPDLGVRTHALKRLVDLGGASVDALIGLLADEEVRWLASGALINIGSAAVGKTVAALKHENPAVRRNALFILRQLDARSAAPSVRDAMSDPDASVQAQAIRTVARFGGKQGMRLVLSKAQSTNPAVRDAAIKALPAFGGAAVPALTALLSHGDARVRASAVRALGSTGGKAAIPRLRRALSDPSPSVRYYACVALGETEDPSVLPEIARLFDDQDSDVRDAASEACSRAPEAARAILVRSLREGNTLQKITAATAVRKAKYRPALPLLVERMRDPSRDVKISAVAALMTFSDPGTVEALVNGLRDPDIQWICILALRQVADGNLRPLLRRSQDPELDYWKQYVLEKMGDRALEGCLDVLAHEQDVGTRIATICTLRQIKDARAAVAVIGLLSDDVLGFVAGFIVSRMGEVAVEPLLLALRDENPVVRSRAALALGEIGLPRAVPGLLELRSDRDERVREAAGRAIEGIRGPEPCCIPSAGPWPE